MVSRQRGSRIAGGAGVYSGGAKLVYGLEIVCEDIWMLVILCGDVLFDGVRKGDDRASPKWKSEQIAKDCQPLPTFDARACASYEVIVTAPV